MIAYFTKHLEQYPLMQPQDFVKLIYQNEFGCGHMITDKQACLLGLHEEYNQSTQKNTQETPLFEPIGNGLCRVSLGQFENALSLETLFAFFVYTANTKKGNAVHFQEKLAQLSFLCKNQMLPFAFDCVALCYYLKSYQQDGYPIVSHSEQYRALYAPSYRVVVDEYQKFFAVFSRIDSLLQTGKNITIAIEGNSASGKSTLANLIQHIYDCNVIHMDDFFLQAHQRTPERLQEIGGNLDYERFMQQIIENTGALSYQKYDCQTAVLGEMIALPQKKLTVIEGVYCMREPFCKAYDLKIFLSLDFTTQSDRILKRNGPFMAKRFETEWLPLENRYFSEMNIAQKCDLIY